MSAKLTVHLVTYNGSEYIPFLFDSLRNQTFKEWELLVIDNNSTDNTVEFVKRGLLNFPVLSRVIINNKNIGFAGGHNQAFRETDAQYFLMLNQDMYVEDNCLEKMVQFLDEHTQAAGVSPRLMRWNFNVLENRSEMLRDSFTNEVDALGIRVFRNRRAIEQGMGEEWGKSSLFLFPPPRNPAPPAMAKEGREVVAEAGSLKVFGLSGALPMFRRSAIQDVLFDDGGFLDESYHMYKEDLDLAYRLASIGAQSFVLLDTIAYHDRTGVGPKNLSDVAAALNKRKHTSVVRYYSYRNHLITLYKNEYWQNLLLDLPWILWYEVKKFVYFLLFDRSVLKGLGEIWKMRKELKEKRIRNKEKRKIGWREMREWWRKF